MARGWRFGVYQSIICDKYTVDSDRSLSTRKARAARGGVHPDTQRMADAIQDYGDPASARIAKAASTSTIQTKSRQGRGAVPPSMVSQHGRGAFRTPRADASRDSLRF